MIERTQYISDTFIVRSLQVQIMFEAEIKGDGYYTFFTQYPT